MKFKGGFYLYMNGFLKPAWKVHFKVNKYILGRIDKEQQKTYSTQDKSIYTFYLRIKLNLNHFSHRTYLCYVFQ